ncbi:type II secretion system F family protein [Fructilactobacillus fructivorans]|uniref:type II secretion system F family protein n=1 Tax=Fructilactobacillus fructivorans TaxID=1614 RepID=UPI000704D3E4|nr:type II secretion system F family protein [Fructilactobacillus fructivorans]KRN40756.1 hypothetical protein IV51_GL001379 [Fructilactobacillus fructivorans]KRN42436.1 hypothetical protein IV48_GL000304 [Fructilactobacillus fructivorans]
MKKIGINIFTGKRISIKQQAFLFSTLGDLLSTGFSIHQSLEFVKVVSKRNQIIVNKIMHGLERGNNLPDSMKFFLSESIYYQLKIADEHGDLVNGMKEIGDFLKLRITQNEKIKAVVVYPIFLFLVLFSIIFAVKFLIMPQTADLTGQTGTRNHHVISYIVYAVGLAIILLGMVCYQNFKAKKCIDRINLLVKIPVIGQLFKAYYQYFVTSNFALMINGGLDLKQVVSALLKFDHQSLLYDVGKTMHASFNEGMNFGASLAHYSFVSEEMIVFLLNGSTQSELAQNLKALSRLSFKEMIRKSNLLIKLIQPVSFAVIGILIVGAYLQMLLPMYDSMKGLY